MKYLLLLLACARLTAAADSVAITATEFPSPARAGAAAPALATAPDGAPWLSWVEPGGTGAANTLRVSRFDPAARTWGRAHLVAADQTVTSNAADVPQVAVDGHGRIYALWTDGHGGADLSASIDGGEHWSAPQPWVRDGHSVEKFSLARLADGRVLAAWIDGRAGAGAASQLYARIVGAAETTDQRVDASVCDCCPTSLAPFLDGGADLAHRGRSAENIRDIMTARFRGEAWDEPRRLNADDWHLNACPVNGPRLSTDGSRIAAAWFTAADNEPRVTVSFSPDAGERWLMPLRIDHGHPIGQVDVVLLRDGTLLATWVETDRSAWLRRISPDFAVNGELELAPPHTVAAGAVPRMALLHDYAGADGGAQVVVALARAAPSTGVRTLLVAVPEGLLLRSERNCDCLPAPAELSGFSIRGTLLGAGAATARVRHAEVPGVFAAGEHEFAIAAASLRPADAGRPFLGRIERRDGAWRLYDVRFLGAPAPAPHR